MLTEATLRELARIEGDPVVTSLYLDLDGRRLPRHSDVVVELDRLLGEAEDESARFGQAAQRAVALDLERIRRWFAAGLDRSGVGGVALFACAARDLLEVLPVALGVTAEAGLGRHARLSQLVAALGDRPPAVVALVDTERSRLYRLGPGEVGERAGPVDRYPRRVDSDVELGSFERRHAEAARRHLRSIAGAITDELGQSPAPFLVLGGPSARELAGQLPAAARSRVVGYVALDLAAGPDEVLAAAGPLLDGAASARRAALVAELDEQSGSRRRGAVGIDEVLAVAGEKNLDTLIVERAYHEDGARCTTCGQLQEAGPSCARCGSGLVAVGDLAEELIAEALAQHADVEVVDELGGGRRIGALERYSRR